MRAVVTGGAGFVGSHLCEVLANEGVQVVCVDNFVTGVASNVPESSRIELITSDVTLGLDVEGPVDFVFHLACPASPRDYLQLPLETLAAGSLGTSMALDLAHAKGARFVFASSSEVYGDPLQHPQSEGYWGNVNPVGPRSAYDESKRFGEALTFAHHQQRGTSTAVARIFNTYGPRMRYNDGRAVPEFITRALEGRPLLVTGDGQQTRSLCHVRDTVRGLISLAYSTEAGPVNIGNPEEITVWALAELIVSLTRSRSVIELVGGAPDDPKRRCPDIRRAQAELGWSPEIGRVEGLKRTIEWFATRQM